MIRYILFLVLIPSLSFGKSFSVIVHKENDVKDIKSAYLLKDDSWKNGENVLPIEIDPSGKIKMLIVKRTFIKEVLGMSMIDYINYWKDRKAAGKGNKPTPNKYFTRIKKIVSQKKGAVGYIPSEEVDSSVREVAKFEVN